MAAGYGLFVRLAFNSEQYAQFFGTISVGFLFVVPLVIGALTHFFAPAQDRKNWLYAIFMPWVSCLIFAVLAIVFSLEAWICVLMALPVFLGMAMLGGLVMWGVFAIFDKRTKSQTTLMSLLLVVPFLITPLENRLPRQDSVRVVHTQVTVEADPAAVWDQITRVSEISEAEHHFSFFHLAGLPRPMEATLSFDGVGGVRRGRWEDGLAFVERISEWQPHERYVMQMEADTSAVAESPLPLKEIGGRYFDVIQGEYAIEPAGNERVILHFTSKYRLSTHFNFYGGLWTDFFMRDVQNYILQIMKARAEAQ
jgi:hypothetical protein